MPRKSTKTIRKKVAISSSAEVRSAFSASLIKAQKSPIVVMKHGRPIVVIQGVRGRSLDEVMRQYEVEVV